MDKKNPSFFNKMIYGLGINGTDTTSASRSQSALSLTDRAERLRKEVGGQKKASLPAEIKDLGTAMEYTFTSSGMSGKLSELEEVILGIKTPKTSDSHHGESISDITEEMCEYLEISDYADMSPMGRVKALEKELFEEPKDGPIVERIEALKKEIYGSP